MGHKLPGQHRSTMATAASRILKHCSMRSRPSVKLGVSTKRKEKEEGGMEGNPRTSGFSGTRASSASAYVLCHSQVRVLDFGLPEDSGHDSGYGEGEEAGGAVKGAVTYRVGGPRRTQRVHS